MQTGGNRSRDYNRPAGVTKSASVHLSSSAETAEGGLSEALVRAAASGDARSMERLLVRVQEVAFRFSLLVCGQAEDAEDVMQEALIQTYRHVDRLREPSAFRTWLFRTVRNACLMKRRRHVAEPRRLESLDDDRAQAPDRAGAYAIADERPAPDELAMNAWLGRRLRRALAEVPASYRAVVILREVEGLSTREAAQVLGVPESTIKMRLHRARALLRSRLETA